MRISLLKALLAIFAISLLAGGAMPALAQQAVEKEPNNTAAAANPLALNGPIEGFANEGGDEDWYLLTVPAPGLDVLIIEVSGPPDIGLTVAFCDAGGKELSLMDREDQGQTLVRLRQAPGKFLIKVLSARGNTEQPYTLAARKSDKVPATADEIRVALTRALDHLAATQQENGSWPGEYGQANAGLAVMSFIGGKCVPKDYSAKLQAGVGYLRSQFTPGSNYPDDPEKAAKEGGLFGTPQLYQHAIATLGVIEAFVDMNDASLEPIAAEAIQLILRSQNTERKPVALQGPVPLDSPHYGSWRYEPDSTDGDISVSVWQILTLRAAVNAGFTVPESAFTAAAKYVRTLRGADGSFCYQAVLNLPPGEEAGDSCARAGMGAIALQLGGFSKDPLIAPAVRFMQAHGPVWNLEYPGNGYPFYYWYYGTRAMYMAGGEDWRVWKDWMCRFLVDHQNEDGSWDGDQNEGNLLETYRTALGALMLEFCCGHVPIYMSAPQRKVPASVRVVFEKDAAVEAPKTVEIIMDASNSMTGMVGKETKIAVARRVLTQTIEGLPDTMNVGLRVYGHRFGTDDYANACRDTELLVPIGPVRKDVLVGIVSKVQTKGRTPLVASVIEAIKDLAKFPNGSIVLVTDGIESCKGDIKSIAAAVKASGLALKVNIVGFDIKEAAARLELESIAKSTDGSYLDARNAGELLAALEQTLKLDYVALDAAGKEAARGVVGGNAIKLSEGAYTIRVLLSPQPVELKVTVKSGAAAVFTLKKTQGKWVLE